jgi:hypothetical protein
LTVTGNGAEAEGEVSVDAGGEGVAQEKMILSTPQIINVGVVPSDT